MAAQDYAILVGISRYKDEKQFPPLDGPLNDVQRVRAWLTSKTDGQEVPDGNVRTLATSADLLMKPPDGGWPSATVWAPTRTGFSELFTKIAFDDAGKPLKREGRLYLYFSGHGFSLDDDETPSAALFSADNFGEVHSNLAGTIYALGVKRRRLFKEVVLIMDCCRDVFGNFVYNGPDFNQVGAGSSEAVKLYALYAAPKRGKSQERELPDSEGKVVGLMTDALLRALKEAPSDVAGQVAGKVLTTVMEFNWKRWYPLKPMPPAPRGVSPDQGDLYFRSRRALVPVTFNVSTALAVGSNLELKSPLWTAIGEVGETSVTWRDTAYSWVQEIPLTAAGAQEFTLVLPPGKHELTIGDAVHSFDPGVINAIAV